MINQRNLFRLQANLTKAGKSIPVKTIEKDYILSWILIGISKSDLKDILAFKGGTALKKLYIHRYRFSEDLDFTLLKSFSLSNLKEKFEDIYQILLKDANIPIRFSRSDEHENGYTIFLNFSGPLSADISKGSIKIDFTKEELLQFTIILKPLLKEYKEYDDIPLNIKLKVYSINEIFVEKILSIMDKSRNEPRDIYDTWYLIANKYISDIFLLKPYIEKKIKFKKLSESSILKVFDEKEIRYRRLWEVRLNNQMIELPQFDKVYRELKRELKEIELT